MIETVLVENFKGIEKVELSLGRVNVFIGPNGAGKSSVLQALALLKQSVGSENLIVNGQEVQLGTWQDIVHGGAANADSEVVFGVAGRLLAFPGEQFSYSLSFRSGSVYRVRVAAGAIGKVFRGDWTREGPNQI